MCIRDRITSLYGRSTTDQYLTVIRSIIETMSEMTTESKTSKYSPHSNTSASIQAAISITRENGLSLAEIADFLSQSRPAITNENLVSRRNVVLALFETLLSVSGRVKRGNFHSTVKPTDLMRYLCRLVTPPSG